MNESDPSDTVPVKLKGVSIGNFKGIKNCEIKDLKDVNLFIGRNGCRKSTIMEAIYFSGKELIRPILPRSIGRRSDRTALSARELWYGYNISAKIMTELRFDNNTTYTMTASASDDLSELQVTSRIGDERISRHTLVSRYRIAGFQHLAHGPPPLISPSADKIRPYFDRSVFIDPDIKRNISHLEATYLNLLRLSEDSSSDLAERTSGIYETQASWEFLPHPDFSIQTTNRFAILEGNRRLFLDNFGDGLHYGLAILAIAKTSQNTALFVEEIESHQHPNSIRNLVSHLLDIRSRNGLQLFITTHSNTALRYFYYYYQNSKDRDKEFRCYHIVSNNETGNVEARTEEGLFNIQEDLDGRSP